MKKIRSSFILLLSLCMVFSAAVPANAKDLEVCYHCEGSGAYHCSICGNSGQVSCDQCGGKGTQACPGEDGKGACSSGWYTCPSCHGDTYLRNGDGQIPQDAAPGSCSTCSGKGKLECIVCHGSGQRTCNSCSGSGKQECQILDCRAARSAGGKCSYCMGTGYLLTNNEPGKNDGVQNKPENGDLIWTNGKSTTYGGGSSGGSGNSGSNTNSGGNSNQGGSGGGGSGNSGSSGGSNNIRYDNNGSNIARDPSNGRDFIWFVDTGSGKWEFGDVLISIERGGKAASGTLDLKFNENITIKSSTGDLGRVHAYITGSGGFKAELERNGDGDISVARHMPGGQYVPFKLSLMIEYEQDEPAEDPVEPGPEVDPPEPGPGQDPAKPDPAEDPNGDPADQPDEKPKYPVDFGSGSWNIDGAEKPVRAMIDGHAVSRVVEVEEYTAIKLADFDGGFMQARIYSDDGFSAVLETNGDNEVSIGRTSSGDIVAPDTALHFEIIYIGGHEPSEENQEKKIYIAFKSQYTGSIYADSKNKSSKAKTEAQKLDESGLILYDRDTKAYHFTVFVGIGNTSGNREKLGFIWQERSSPHRAIYLVKDESAELRLYSFTTKSTQSISEYLKVYVASVDGIVAELPIDENNCVSLSRRIPADSVLPEKLAICFKGIKHTGLVFDTTSCSKAPVDSYYVKDYNLNSVNDNNISEIQLVPAAEMSTAERNTFLNYTEEERTALGNEVESIVRTASVGTPDSALKSKLKKIAKQNGYANSELVNAIFIPIQFEGHIELGFPVNVKVRLDQKYVSEDILSGKKPVFLYHIKSNGEIELINHYTLITSQNSYASLQFTTTSFSDFFLSEVELTKGLGEPDEDYFYEHLGIKKPFPTTAVIIAAAAVAVVAAAVAAVTILSRRKKV